MATNDLRSYLHRTCVSLNKAGVKYMIVGNVAIAYYELIRQEGLSALDSGATDTVISIWYQPTIENYKGIVSALRGLGIPDRQLAQAIFPDRSYLKISLDNFTLKFRPLVPGVGRFEVCLTRAESVVLDGEELMIIGAEDLEKYIQKVNQ